MAPRARSPFDHPESKDGQGAGRTGHNDIEIGQLFVNIGQLLGFGHEARSQKISAFQRAVGHNHLLGIERGEVRGTELNHFARAYEQYIGLRQIAEYTLGQAHGGSGHGNRMRADGGLRTDFFGHRESALKKLRSEEHTSELQSLMRTSY